MNKTKFVKGMAFIFIISLFISIRPQYVQAYSDYQDPILADVYWRYVESYSGLTIIGCTLNSNATYDTLTIPSSINGDPVTRIDHVLNSNNNFENLVIPSSILEIGDFSVVACNGMKTISILGNLTSIGNAAFYGCKSLESINLPDTIQYIDEYAFSDCQSLKSITLPVGLRKLNDYVFLNCYSLSNVACNNNLQSIGISFQSCKSLKSITIPNSVTSIHQSAFSNCPEMSEVTVMENNAKYSSNDGILYNRSKTTLIYCPPGKAGSLTVLPSVLIIGEGGFQGCTKLDEIDLPEKLAVIENYAFNACIGLNAIEIPSSVVYLGYAVFVGCTNLTSISIPPNISVINEMMFYNCNELAEVTLPSNTTEIKMGAFYGCTSLNQISIPSKVTKLGDYAFYECTNLKKVIFNGNQPSIGSLAFPASGTVLYYPISRTSSWSSLTGYSKQAYCYVTINLQNGSAASKTMTNVTNGLINTPASPAARAGYTFKGWFKEAACSNTWNFNTDAITKDISVYAKWEANSYTVKFDSQGGSAVASKTAKYDTIIAAPAAPTRNGYAFGGWYLEKECKNIWNFSLSKITGNITLYAKWNVLYSISATPNNTAYGSVSGAGSYISGASVTLKAVPKSGYRFVRWLEGSTAVSTNAEYKFSINKSRTFKAEFTLIGIPAVKASSAGYSGIKLSWNAVLGAKEYEIYRATSSAGTYAKISLTTSIGYADTGLTSGVTYYYKVRVKCLAGTLSTYGAYSPVCSVKPIPATPVGASASSASYNSIKLIWSAVGGATKYEIYRATSSTGTYTKLSETASLNYTDTALTTGSVYYYKVRAYRLVGSTKVYGRFCSAVSAKPLPATVTGAKATKASLTSIKVIWNAVNGATKYEIYGSESSNGTYVKLSETSSVNFTQSKLQAGKTYYYKVRAYRLIGTTKIYGNFSSETYIKL